MPGAYVTRVNRSFLIHLCQNVTYGRLYSVCACAPFPSSHQQEVVLRVQFSISRGSFFDNQCFL